MKVIGSTKGKLDQQYCSRKADNGKGGSHEDFMEDIMMPAPFGMNWCDREEVDHGVGDMKVVL